jgi:hypothetical protein
MNQPNMAGKTNSYKQTLELVNRLQKLLGLPSHLTDLNIKWSVGELLQVTCSCFPQLPKNDNGSDETQKND